jgi:peptidoglycan-associated lipoprotein
MKIRCASFSKSILSAAAVAALSSSLLVSGCSSTPKAEPSEGIVTSPNAPAQDAQQPDAGADLKSSGLATVYFDFDSYVLTSDSRTSLSQAAEALKAKTGARIQIEGHCDERGSNEYNLALGERRANAAKNFLAAQGVGADRLSIISYGKERPAVDGSTEEAWAKNRRAVTVVVSGGR